VAAKRLVISLSAAADAVEGSASDLNRLDGYAGDGDLGITMSQAAQALREVLAQSDDMSVGQLLSSCGAAIARSAPSTSGTLVATAFLRAAKALADPPANDVEALVRAFRAALEGIQARGKAAVGDRTLVDGVDAVCNSLQLSLFSDLTTGEALDQAARAASAAADATAEMEPKAGRASWVPERAKGHPDAGCTMLAIALKGAAASLRPS
jgi:dihydroxyacetone kinase